MSVAHTLPGLADGAGFPVGAPVDVATVRPTEPLIDPDDVIADAMSPAHLAARAGIVLGRPSANAPSSSKIADPLASDGSAAFCPSTLKP